MQTSKIKLLVTGAGGFLGSRVVDHYSQKYSITGTTRKQMDFTKYTQVESMMKDIKPDVVIHCGAVSDVAKCAEIPEEAYEINVLGTSNIAKACEQYHAKMVFCSSDQVYFGAKGILPHKENEMLAPPHIYGRLKLQAEQECFRFHPDSVILRLSWMYDTKEQKEKEHSNLYWNVKNALRKGESLQFPIYDFRSITNVWETVQNLEYAWKLPSGIYNFGSSNPNSTYEVVVRLLKLMGFQDTHVLQNTEAFADNPRNLTMDLNKILNHGISFNETMEGFKEALYSLSVEEYNKL